MTFPSGKYLNHSVIFFSDNPFVHGLITVFPIVTIASASMHSNLHSSRFIKLEYYVALYDLNTNLNLTTKIIKFRST